MTPQEFFRTPHHVTQRRYEALRAFYLDGCNAEQVAQRFGYTVNTVYSLTRDFQRQLNQSSASEHFFVTPTRGRQPKQTTESLHRLIIELRKKYLSVPDIKAIIDALGEEVSEKYIYEVVHREGFSRLPRRSRDQRSQALSQVTLEAPKSALLDYGSETFQTQNSAGLLCLLPYLQAYGIDQLIEQSGYPGSASLPRLNAVLSFLALKLSKVRRYSADDLWCMDRGLGLFAGLNVLPKTAWFTSYSHRVTRTQNLEFLKHLAQCWQQHGLLSDTANLDFTTLPYWGDDAHLETHWSGTRHTALASVLAVLAHDPDSGIITYGDTHPRHHNQAGVVVEFLDFYRHNGDDDLRYLVFDSKFTTYENLRTLDDAGIKFLTIRRRGKHIVDRLQAIPKTQQRTLRVPAAGGKTRRLQVIDETLKLKGYARPIRQVAIVGPARIQPALIITNDFELALEAIVRKYARRWLVEKTISEHIEFFHLNRLSSSMVIKVDFDLTMTILAHNLYRLIARDLPGYSHYTANSLFERFIYNSGDIQITPSRITIEMKKKRHLPALLTLMEPFQNQPIRWMHQRALRFQGASRS